MIVAASRCGSEPDVDFWPAGYLAALTVRFLAAWAVSVAVAVEMGLEPTVVPDAEHPAVVYLHRQYERTQGLRGGDPVALRPLDVEVARQVLDDAALSLRQRCRALDQAAYMREERAS